MSRRRANGAARPARGTKNRRRGRSSKSFASRRRAGWGQRSARRPCPPSRRASSMLKRWRRVSASARGLGAKLGRMSTSMLPTQATPTGNGASSFPGGEAERPSSTSTDSPLIASGIAAYASAPCPKQPWRSPCRCPRWKSSSWRTHRRRPFGRIASTLATARSGLSISRKLYLATLLSFSTPRSTISAWARRTRQIPALLSPVRG